jgi:class 3 adenylate cyclase
MRWRQSHVATGVAGMAEERKLVTLLFADVTGSTVIG